MLSAESGGSICPWSLSSLSKVDPDLRVRELLRMSGPVVLDCLIKARRR